METKEQFKDRVQVPFLFDVEKIMEEVHALVKDNYE
jgi:hypothetical protein